MKILFIQLPDQTPPGEEPVPNVPFIAGQVIAHASGNGRIRRDECSFLDGNTADHGGDAAIVAAGRNEAPDMAVFTLQPWNLERSIWIARKLRNLLPATHFAAMGPEVAAGSSVYRAQAFDALLEGEPEIPFLSLLSDLEHKSLRPSYAAGSVLQAQDIPDPYANGILVPRPDQPVILETVRSCPSSCLFCARHDVELRYRSLESVYKTVRMASEAPAWEIRIVDPPLQWRPDFTGFLKALAVANEAGIPVYASLSLEAVTDEVARLCADAGIASVDAALRTTNPRALEAAGCGLDKDAFERGAHLLSGQMVRPRPGLLLGMPHDSYENVIETFDYLGMIGLGQDADLRPLALVPGSAFRERSGANGIREYLEKPPYYVLETDWMREEDFLDAVADFEESFEVAWGAHVAPCFERERDGFTSFADLRPREALDALLVSPERLGSSVTLLMDGDDPESIARVARAAKDLRKENPHTLWQLALFSNSAIPGSQAVSRLEDAFSMPEHYFELSHVFSPDPQTSFQTRLFFVTKSAPLALKSLKEFQRLETAFVLDPGNPPPPKLLDAVPFLVFDRENASFELLYDILSAYRAYPDMLVEASSGIFLKDARAP